MSDWLGWCTTNQNGAEKNHQVHKSQGWKRKLCADSHWAKSTLSEPLMASTRRPSSFAVFSSSASQEELPPATCECPSSRAGRGHKIGTGDATGQVIIIPPPNLTPHCKTCPNVTVFPHWSDNRRSAGGGRGTPKLFIMWQSGNKLDIFCRENVISSWVSSWESSWKSLEALEIPPKFKTGGSYLRHSEWGKILTNDKNFQRVNSVENTFQWMKFQFGIFYFGKKSFAVQHAPLHSLSWRNHSPNMYTLYKRGNQKSNRNTAGRRSGWVSIVQLQALNIIMKHGAFQHGGQGDELKAYGGNCNWHFEILVE